MRIHRIIWIIFTLIIRKEFAYAASDKLVYIRKFSTIGHEMTLSAVLQGHDAEVTRVWLIHISGTVSFRLLENHSSCNLRAFGIA